MKCIRNICLYLKKYISDKQFERIFYQDIDDFKNSLEENIYWKILFSNFNKKEDIISMNTDLYDYVEKNYKSVYDEISDAYIEKLIETNEKNEIIDILKKKYKQKEEVFINCCMIDTKLELIYSVNYSRLTPYEC